MVLTYQLLLLVSFLLSTIDHPPGRAEEGEKEEGKERRGGKEELAEGNDEPVD